VQTQLSCTPPSRCQLGEDSSRIPLAVVSLRVLSNITSRAQLPSRFLQAALRGFPPAFASNPSVLSLLLTGYQPGSTQTGHDCLAVHAHESVAPPSYCLALLVQGLRQVRVASDEHVWSFPQTTAPPAVRLSLTWPADFYSNHAPGHQLASKRPCRAVRAVSQTARG
jgi:hypothetical protein